MEKVLEIFNKVEKQMEEDPGIRSKRLRSELKKHIIDYLETPKFEEELSHMMADRQTMKLHHANGQKGSLITKNIISIRIKPDVYLQFSFDKPIPFNNIERIYVYISMPHIIMGEIWELSELYSD